EKNDTYRINTNKATRFAITIIDDDFPAFADGSDPTEKSTDFSESKCITVITDNQISCPDPNNYWLGPC
ncbi:MAG: hypothetical protein HYW50_03660, partial [Candidatus Diapherotrites archaeon]|nr:hypothetical protein [Candidatus Diapherotrites archaeon]